MANVYITGILIYYIVSYFVCNGQETGTFCFEEVVSFIQNRGTCNIPRKELEDFLEGSKNSTLTPVNLTGYPKSSKSYPTKKNSIHSCDEVCDISLANSTSEKVKIASINVYRFGNKRNINFTIQTGNCNSVGEAIHFNIICGQIKNKEKYIFERCHDNRQCGKTTGATFCASLNDRKVCQCSEGYMYYDKRCIQRSVSFDFTCELTDQCRMRTKGSVCLKEGKENRKTCQCDAGFQRNGDECILAESIISTAAPISSIGFQSSSKSCPNVTSFNEGHQDHPCNRSRTFPFTDNEWFIILVASAGFGLGIICSSIVFLVIWRCRNRKKIACAEKYPMTSTTTEIYKTSRGNDDMHGESEVNFKIVYSNQDSNPYSQAGKASTQDVYNHLRENREVFLNPDIYDVSQPLSDDVNLGSATGDYDLAKNVFMTAL